MKGPLFRDGPRCLGCEHLLFSHFDGHCRVHQPLYKQKKRFDDLELIFRDQDHVERFLSNVRDDGGDSW